MKTIRFLAAALFVAAFCIKASSSELTGTVESQSGHPLADVSVISVGSNRDETKTDANGFFKLPDHGRVVFFRHKDFRPITKVLDSDVTNLDVILDDAIGSERLVPSCASTDNREKRIGYESKYLVPKGLKVRRVRDADYVEWILYSKKDKREWLELWSGPTVSNGFPRDELLTSSESFTERYWRCEMGGGIDMRGRSKNGMRWRFTSLPYGLATYENVSEETAAIFDLIIDGACWDKALFDTRSDANHGAHNKALQLTAR
jgi:hypothetical protein